jgi:hypothetical protein
MRVQQRPIPAEFCDGDYGQDARFRAVFNRWLASLWEQKDAEIDRLLAASQAPDGRAAAGGPGAG